MGAIKINNQSIAKLYLGNIAVKRAYSNGSIVYDAYRPQPCFEVVETITDATGNFVDVYATDTEKWYKKNNLSQYEEYGIMPSVADLSTLTYYVGKLAICTTDSHEYKWNGNTWVDLGSCIPNVIFLDPAASSSTKYNFPVEYYFGTGYKLRVLLYLTGSFSGDTGGIFNNHEHSPIKVSFFREGYYFDSHYPTSTTEPATNNPDYSNRVYKSEIFTNDYKNRFMIMEVQMNKIAFYDYNTGTELTDIGGGSVATVTGWYDGLYYTVYNPNAKNPVHAAYFQVVDNNGNVVNDIRPVLNNGEIVLHDSIINVDYNKTSGTVQYHTEHIGQITPVEEYDTKVAPANNVHYNTLAELELMECPWIGMTATIGESYTPYIYTVDGWTKAQETPCFEVVRTISAATGNYIDVYVSSEAKWYKKNNLNQYEEYGVMEHTYDLSSLTYYVGKLVLLDTDCHEYRWDGTQWVDLGSAGTFEKRYWLYTYGQEDANFSAPINYYWGTGYRMELCVKNGRSATFYGVDMLFNFQNTSPLQLKSRSSNLEAYTYYPASTSDNSVTTGTSITVKDFFGSVFYNKNLIITFENDRIIITDEETGTQISSQGSLNTITDWFNGLYSDVLKPQYGDHFAWMKVYDENGNLVNYIKSKYNSGLSASRIISMYDYVTSTEYTNTLTSDIKYYFDYMGTISPVVDYDTKVAPPNHVHYNTLAELKLMECPWIGMQATIGENNDPYIYTANGWVPYIPSYIDQYLTIESLVDNNVIKWKNSSSSGVLKHIYYSTDGDIWRGEFSSYNGATLATLNTGDKLYLKADHITGSWNDHCMFTASGQYNVYGNLLSLIYMDEFADKSSIDSTECFIQTFNSTPVVSAENLVIPITAVPDSGLRELFISCTSLVSADISYIQSAGKYSMMNMFKGCTSLESIKLPSSELTLNTYAFYNAFNGCSNLATDIVLTLSGGYSSVCQTMFSGCTSLKKVTLNITSTADLGVGSAFNRMFYGCTGLENAYFNFYGNLTGTGSTCKEMFSGCSSLSYIKAMPKNINFSGPGSSLPTCNWVSGVAANGTFVKNSQATWNKTGTNGVPSGWSVQTENPPS